MGRVSRDLARKIIQRPELGDEFSELLALSERLLSQRRESKNKLYSIHAPEVHCISKGKVHKRYEFGCKVGLVSPVKNAFIVGALAFEGSPYDGQTLKDSLNQMKRFLGRDKLDDVYVDDGYKNHGCEDMAEVHLVRRG